MTNREIGVNLGLRIREERTKTNEVLQLINLAQERRAIWNGDSRQCSIGWCVALAIPMRPLTGASRRLA